MSASCPRMAKKPKKRTTKARTPASEAREDGVPSEPTKRLTVAVSQSLSDSIDEEIERIRRVRPGSRATRSSLAKNILAKVLLEPSDSHWCQPEARDGLQQEADLMEAEAEMLRASDERAASRSMYLQAAAKEIEALSVLSDPSEAVILSSLFRILPLIKRGTGYRHLPAVPADPDR